MGKSAWLFGFNQTSFNGLPAQLDESVKTQTATASIATRRLLTQSASAAISIKGTKTQLATAAISGSSYSTQTTVAIISNLQSKTQSADAEIGQTHTLTQEATAQIGFTAVAEQSASASLIAVQDFTQTAVAFVGVAYGVPPAGGGDEKYDIGVVNSGDYDVVAIDENNIYGIE